MNYLVLHIIVFIWGFTGILGNEISLQAPQLVGYRMWIAAAALLLFNVYIRLRRKRVQAIMVKNVIDYKPVNGASPLAQHRISILLASTCVALHWIFFFGSIKASNINIGVVCMSTQAFMISLIQPLIKRTGIKPIEIILGLLVVAAMVIIFGFEYRYKTGIWMGLVSSFFAVLFTLLNARMVKELPATVISGWEMGIGAVLVTLYLAVTGGLTAAQVQLQGSDLIYLLLLGIVCTALAFAVSVQIMKKLSPYTVSLSVNLEPVYTILLALCFYPDKEVMSAGFYGGTAILIGTVVTDAIISSRYHKK